MAYALRDKKLGDSLTVIGLSPAEHEAFELLFLELSGGTRAHLVARVLEIPRSTAYSILNGLVKKGIATRRKQYGSTFMIDRRSISEYIDSRHKAMQQAHEYIFALRDDLDHNI
jgi:predicted transcriptional regulator